MLMVIKENKMIETILEFKVGNFEYRLWLTEKEIGDYDYQGLYKEIYSHLSSDTFSTKGVVNYLESKIKNLSKIQIRKAGLSLSQGIIVYIKTK